MTTNWTQLPLRTESQGSSMCMIHGDSLMEIGGYEQQETTVKIFNLATYNQLQPTPRMLIGRRWSAATYVAELDEALVFGGVKGHDAQPVHEVEIFNCRENRWHVGASQTHSYKCPILANDGMDTVLCIPDTSQGSNRSVEYYDVKQNRWYPGPTIPDAVPSTRGTSAYCQNEVLYVVGGYDRVCARTDLRDGSQRWDILPGPQVPHGYGALLLTPGGEIILFDRLDFNAVFYGEVISGSKMPNLMYMTTFDNQESRDAKSQ